MNDLRIDSTKLMYHPERVAEWRHAGNDWELAKQIAPIYVEISPVGACNHRCTFCAVDYIGYKSVQLDPYTLIHALAGMANVGVRSVMFAGEGEPLLYKRINEVVTAAVSFGLDVSFTTNGVLLDKLTALDKCKWVKVSMNAGTRETYAKVHRTKPEDFDRVWENIAEATKRKGGCTIGVQMVMLPENEREVDDLYARASVAEVDYVVLKPYSQHKFSLTHEYEPFRPATFMHMEITDHKPFLYVRSDVPSHEPPRYTRCHSTPNFWAYVMASGDVYSCSAYLLDERFNLGNIAVESFPAIWRGEGRRRNFDLLKTLDIGECRRNCRMNQSNNYLWDLAQGIPHQNFI